jgi:hypothetical protein
MEKMQNAMMKQYKMFAWIGILIVLFAFWQSLNASNANTVFFSADKATREAAGAGTALVAANVLRHSLPTWVPALKFLGLGIMLGSITMALGLIATTLREMGISVMATWPASLNPGTPEKPRSARVFPLVMMMGWMVLLIGFIWAMVLNGTVVAYWSHSIATELNPAQPGSVLLNQLGLIKGTLPWLGFLRFLGMATLFTGITIALTVIIRTLQYQEKTLVTFVRARALGSGD